jgi:hypothetical protein
MKINIFLASAAVASLALAGAAFAQTPSTAPSGQPTAAPASTASAPAKTGVKHHKPSVKRHHARHKTAKSKTKAVVKSAN